MRTLDLTPLFRSTIGFDHMMDLLETISSSNSGASYPPYNIEKTADNYYRITMAVAGFTQDELNITLHEHTLVIQGKAAAEDENIEYIHKGIAKRAFERHFQLADFIEVGEAELENGLLMIHLTRRVPENIKPKQINITKGKKPKKITKLIEG